MKANNMNNEIKNTETEFVNFINANSEKVKALADLSKMTESEKLELVKQFKASK